MIRSHQCSIRQTPGATAGNPYEFSSVEQDRGRETSKYTVIYRAVENVALPVVLSPRRINSYASWPVPPSLSDRLPRIGSLASRSRPRQFSQISGVGVFRTLRHPSSHQRTLIDASDDRIQIFRKNQPTIDMTPEFPTPPRAPLFVLRDSLIPVMVGVQHDPAYSIGVSFSHQRHELRCVSNLSRPVFSYRRVGGAVARPSWNPPCVAVRRKRSAQFQTVIVVAPSTWSRQRRVDIAAEELPRTRKRCRLTTEVIHHVEIVGDSCNELPQCDPLVLLAEALGLVSTSVNPISSTIFIECGEPVRSPTERKHALEHPTLGTLCGICRCPLTLWLVGRNRILAEVTNFGLDDITSKITQAEDRHEQITVAPIPGAAIGFLFPVGALKLFFRTCASGWSRAVRWLHFSVLMLLEETMFGTPFVNTPNGISRDDVGNLRFCECDAAQFICHGDG